MKTRGDQLKHFFAPESIAVIGASNNKNKVGGTIIENLKSAYRGIIYPINLREDEVQGIKAYKSVLDVPEVPDIAIIAVPNKIVPQVTKECGGKGLKFAIIITAGFKEIGIEGLKLEKEILEIAEKYGTRILGPNCLGILNPKIKMNATFSPSMPREGNVAVFSQSGALCSTILDWAVKEGVGFSNFVSLGNKADLTENDFLEYWLEDEDTEVIIGYLEGVSDGDKFIDISRRISKKKPFILIKAGRTSAGAKAASSHTGTLAGTEKAYIAAFEKTGVIRAESVEEWLDMMQAFSYQPLPKGERIAILTNAGGPAIIAADACERSGIKLASISDKTIERLKKSIPNTANLYNPIDILGDAGAERYKYTLDALLEDENISGCIVILTPQAMTNPDEVAKKIVDVSGRYDKPVLACFMGGALVSRSIQYLKRNGIPNYSDPERVVLCMNALLKQYKNRFRKEGDVKKFEVDKKSVVNILSRYESPSIDFLDCMKILEAYGISTAKFAYATSFEEAIKVSENIGYPVAMKIVSPDIPHKTDVGGVKIDIKNEEELRKAHIKMMSDVNRFAPEARIKGILIQEMVREGREVILGVDKDPQFGHLLMFGLGGIYVEFLKDVTFKITPISEREAYEMIYGIKTYQLLKGVRGEASSDIKAIVESLQRISQLVTDFKQIVELDINPLIVKKEKEGCLVVDVRMIKEV